MMVVPNGRSELNLAFHMAFAGPLRARWSYRCGVSYKRVAEIAKNLAGERSPESLS
jgi:hypothetical protein